MIKDISFYFNTNIVTIKIYIPSKVVIFHINMHVRLLEVKVPSIKNEVHIEPVIFLHTYTMHKCKYQK